MSDDPKKPTKQELAKANDFAKQFAMRKKLITGEDTNVGNSIPPFIDSSTGLDITGQPSQSTLPYNTITDIRKIPYYVTADDIKYDDNVPYYIDQQSGDQQPIHPDIARSSRFNPNRGQTIPDNYLASKLKMNDRSRL